MPKLPETKQEWEKIKKYFLSKHKIEDSPETWTFILSQLQNTKMPDLDFKYEVVFAHYKRWKIAKVLQDEKTVYIQELEAKLKAQMELMAQQGEGHEGASPSEHTEHMPDGSHHFEGELPPLPDLEEGVVSNP